MCVSIKNFHFWKILFCQLSLSVAVWVTFCGSVDYLWGNKGRNGSGTCQWTANRRWNELWETLNFHLFFFIFLKTTDDHRPSQCESTFVAEWDAINDFPPFADLFTKWMKMQEKWKRRDHWLWVLFGLHMVPSAESMKSCDSLAFCLWLDAIQMENKISRDSFYCARQANFIWTNSQSKTSVSRFSWIFSSFFFFVNRFFSDVSRTGNANHGIEFWYIIPLFFVVFNSIKIDWINVKLLENS